MRSGKAKKREGGLYDKNKMHEMLRAFLTKPDTQTGKSLLHIACSRGHVQFVTKILDYVQCIKPGAHTILLSKDSQGQTILHESCRVSDIKVVQAVIDVADKYQNQNQCVERLLCQQDNYDRTAFYETFETADIDKVNYLLRQATMAKCVNKLLSLADLEGFTVFHRSCLNMYDSARCLDTVIKSSEASKEEEKQLNDVLSMKSNDEENIFYYIPQAIDEIAMLLVHADFKGNLLNEYLEKQKTNERTILHEAFRRGNRDRSRRTRGRTHTGSSRDARRGSRGHKTQGRAAGRLRPGRQDQRRGDGLFGRFHDL